MMKNKREEFIKLVVNTGLAGLTSKGYLREWAGNSNVHSDLYCF